MSTMSILKEVMFRRPGALYCSQYSYTLLSKVPSVTAVSSWEEISSYDTLGILILISYCKSMDGTAARRLMPLRNEVKGGMEETYAVISCTGSFVDTPFKRREESSTTKLMMLSVVTFVIQVAIALRKTSV